MLILWTAIAGFCMAAGSFAFSVHLLLVCACVCVCLCVIARALFVYTAQKYKYVRSLLNSHVFKLQYINGVH